MSDFDKAMKNIEKEHPDVTAFIKEHQNDEITISFREFVEKSADVASYIIKSQTSALMGAFANEICQKFISISALELFRGSFDGNEGKAD